MCFINVKYIFVSLSLSTYANDSRRRRVSMRKSASKQWAKKKKSEEKLLNDLN